MLLPIRRYVKINSDKQHAIFAHELQSALKFTVGFWNVYCELQQICHNCVTDLSFQHWMKVKLTISNFSCFIIIYKCFCICIFKQLYLGNQSELDTRPHGLFSLQWPTISPPKLSTWIALYIPAYTLYDVHIRTVAQFCVGEMWIHPAFK